MATTAALAKKYEADITVLGILFNLCHICYMQYTVEN